MIGAALLLFFFAAISLPLCAHAQSDMQWLSVDDTRFHWTNAMAWEARAGGLQPVRVPKEQRDNWSQANQKKRAMSGAAAQSTPALHRPISRSASVASLNSTMRSTLSSGPTTRP